MELKYYLRGLGLGIIVTAIIMGVATSGRQPMSDAEIISRAKQLGMIEDRVLSESAAKEEDTDNKEPEQQENNEQAGQNGQTDTKQDETTSGQSTVGRNEAEPAASGTKQNEIVSGVSDAEQDEEEPRVSDAEQGQTDLDVSAVGQNAAENGRRTDTQAQTESDNDEEERLPASNAPMVITIGSGDGSYAVSRKLADIGAISSPENFDTFLCENGYDKKIRTGTYTIPADASDEQMARIITGAE